MAQRGRNSTVPDADETWAAACRRRNPVRESPREAEPDRLEERGDAVKRKAGKFHGFPRTRVQPVHYPFYLLGFLPTQVPVAHLLAARPIQQNGSQFFAYSVGVSLSITRKDEIASILTSCPRRTTVHCNLCNGTAQLRILQRVQEMHMCSKSIEAT